MKDTCYGCQVRYVGCHGSCEAYQVEVEQRAQVKEMRRQALMKERDIAEFQKAQVRKYKKQHA